MRYVNSNPGMEYQTKLIEKYMTVYFVSQVVKVATSYEKLHDTARFLVGFKE